jgi:integrase
MKSTPRRRGRSIGFYRDSSGEEHKGLTRRTDGRWRISATGEFFREPDERLAIARFHAIMAKLRGEDKVAMPLELRGDMEAAFAAVATLDASKLTAEFAPGRPAIYTATVGVGSAAFFAIVREMCINDPKTLSLKTGVEWLSRGADLPKPTPSPTANEMIEAYTSKPKLTKDESTRCERFWNEFVSATGIATLRELTHEKVAAYEQKISGQGLAPKTVKHKFSAIKTVIAYGLRRGKCVEDCRRCLDILAMLETENGNTLDPRPIAVADFWKIHAAAFKAKDVSFAAMMLAAANLCMYPSEVAALKWDDLDLKRGEFSAKRNKTSVPRVGTLWPETLAALKKLPKNRPNVFIRRTAAYVRATIHIDWTNYRKAAGVKATFNQIRDASFTVACRASLDQARLLAGHRLAGAADNYVLRQPQAVAAACEAIRAEFYGAKT